MEKNGLAAYCFLFLNISKGLTMSVSAEPSIILRHFIYRGPTANAERGEQVVKIAIQCANLANQYRIDIPPSDDSMSRGLQVCIKAANSATEQRSDSLRVKITQVARLTLQAGIQKSDGSQTFKDVPLTVGNVQVGKKYFLWVTSDEELNLSARIGTMGEFLNSEMLFAITSAMKLDLMLLDTFSPSGSEQEARDQQWHSYRLQDPGVLGITLQMSAVQWHMTRNNIADSLTLSEAQQFEQLYSTLNQKMQDNGLTPIGGYSNQHPGTNRRTSLSSITLAQIIERLFVLSMNNRE